MTGEKKYGILFPCLLLLCFFLISCLGVRADIVLNQDNTGTITLEYRISRLLESLGAQDGNAAWLPVPIGRADFERSIARLPGIRMLSFSSRRGSGDLINTVRLQFSSIEALMFFLDPGGEKAIYQTWGDRKSFTLRLSDFGGVNNDSDNSFMELIETISASYSVNISLSLPTDGTLTAPVLAGSQIMPTGRKLNYSLPVNTIYSSLTPIILEFNW